MMDSQMKGLVDRLLSERDNIDQHNKFPTCILCYNYDITDDDVKLLNDIFGEAIVFYKEYHYAYPLRGYTIADYRGKINTDRMKEMLFTGLDLRMYPFSDYHMEGAIRYLMNWMIMDGYTNIRICGTYGYEHFIYALKNRYVTCPKIMMSTYYNSLNGITKKYCIKELIDITLIVPDYFPYQVPDDIKVLQEWRPKMSNRVHSDAVITCLH